MSRSAGAPSTGDTMRAATVKTLSVTRLYALRSLADRPVVLEVQLTGRVVWWFADGGVLVSMHPRTSRALSECVSAGWVHVAANGDVFGQHVARLTDDGRALMEAAPQT